MSRIIFPAQNVPIQTKYGEVDPTWYGKIKQLEAVINGGAIGDGVLPLTATTGFGFLPTMAGQPTGVPLTPGRASTPIAQYPYVPCVFDTLHSKLWIYTGGAWKGVVVA
jgi:hypothetical protein